MNYTKPMIELVYEIRRMVPSELKPSVKMANPELFDELAQHYHSDAKTITKALIKELLHLAGEEWSELLEASQAEEATNKADVKSHSHSAKMYRGVVSLVEKRLANQDNSVKTDVDVGDKPAATPKRVYRGQVIG